MHGSLPAFRVAVSSALARCCTGSIVISTGNRALNRAGTGWGQNTCRNTWGASRWPTAWGTMERAASPNTRDRERGREGHVGAPGRVVVAGQNTKPSNSRQPATASASATSVPQEWPTMTGRSTFSALARDREDVPAPKRSRPASAVGRLNKAAQGPWLTGLIGL